MIDQSAGGTATIQDAAVASILAEYETFKTNYANDSLVQAMAVKLAELAVAAQASPRRLRHGDRPETMNAVLESTATAQSARAAWDKYREGTPLPPEDAFLFAAGYIAGYADAPELASEINSSDRERLLYVARVLRSLADLEASQPIGSLWQETVGAVGTIQRVLDIEDADCEALGLKAASMRVSQSGSPEVQSPLMNGWKEAAIAWNVCASLHERFAKGQDALFTTRQADYKRHFAAARKAYFTVLGEDLAFDAQVLARVSAATASNYASALELIKAIAKLDARGITAKSTKSVAQRWLREHKHAAGVPVGELLHVGTLSVFRDSESSFGHGYDICTNSDGHRALVPLDGGQVYVVKPTVETVA
jgi:hypothetical protein